MTKPIEKSITTMFKVSFPEWYEKYRKAFEPGVWLREDPGPFLGRAIIYKLQGRLHKDANSLGPSASFGVGDYTGGEMLFLSLVLNSGKFLNFIITIILNNIHH
jgi:hypothetical protein